MADSTLDYTGEEPGTTRKGHGVGSLGPSDSSDSGSDIVGGPGMRDHVDPGIGQGTSSDPDAGATNTAGPDIGDGNLDGDSDAFGTGERADAGRDPARTDRDISVDRIAPVSGEPGFVDPRDDVDRLIDSGALSDAGPLGDDDAPGNPRAVDDEALEDRGLLPGDDESSGDAEGDAGDR